jgi:hypothetical protein
MLLTKPPGAVASRKEAVNVRKKLIFSTFERGNLPKIPKADAKNVNASSSAIAPRNCLEKKAHSRLQREDR